MDPDHERILREERRRMARVKRESERFRQTKRKPKVNLEEHPFCESRQLNDLKDIRKEGRRRVIQWAGPAARAYRKRDPGLPSGKVRSILRDTLEMAQRDEAEKDQSPSRKSSSTRQKSTSDNLVRLKSPSFGHRPESASRMADPLDRSRNMMPANYLATNYEQKQVPVLMSTDDLHRLIHAPDLSNSMSAISLPKCPPYTAAERKKRSNIGDSYVLPSRADPAEVKPPVWFDRVIMPEVERLQKGQRPLHLEVNAVLKHADNMRFSRDDRFTLHRQATSRRAAGHNEHPFCVLRQRQDTIQCSNDNSTHNFRTGAPLSRPPPI
mmetsp:Transcript_19987/g.39260  ORF Transcript_19987/g.39260 Transcript_19987/m.39260 type:complete len:324 (+) Transcript_19987:229-1200(+)